MNELSNNYQNENIASWMLALLIISRLLISWLANFVGSNSPGMLVMGGIWILSIYYLYLKRSLLIRKGHFLFIPIVVLLLIFSNLTSSGHIRDLSIMFVQYCLVGYIVGTSSFDIKKVCQYVCYLEILLIFPIYQMLQFDLTHMWQKSITMDHSYFILPIVLCVFSHFFYYREKSNLIIKISYAIGIVLAGLLFLTGTRGATLSLIVFILLVYSNSNRGKNISNNRKLFLFFVVFIVIVMFNYILNGINTFLIGIGINLEFLQRTIIYLQNGDMSNGRTEIYRIAIDGFLNSPICGNGIGAFTDNYPKLGYPHNMILQFLYEGGLMLGIPSIYILIKAIKNIIGFNQSFSKYTVVNIVLFAATIIPAFLSNEPWVYSLLWCYFAVILGGRR